MTASTVRAYLRSYRAMVAALNVAQGAFEGVWLGTLRGSDFDLAGGIAYSRKRMYHDEGYNRRGLWGWERAAIEAHFPASGRLAVAAAGAGREVLALVERGYDVVGFECNEGLRQLGNALTTASGHGSRIFPQQPNRWPVDAGEFDAAIVGWGAYSHIRGRSQRVSFLRELRASLAHDAPVLLSFLVRRGDDARFRTSAAVGERLRLLSRRTSVEAVERGDALNPEFVHFATRHEIMSELADAGLEMVMFSQEGYGRAVARPRARITTDQGVKA